MRIQPRDPSVGAVLALAGMALLSTCVSEDKLSRIDERARATKARTVLLEPDLSLYSPYEFPQTRGHLEQLRAQRDEVFALFELERGEPLLVWLRADEGMGPEVSVEKDGIRIDTLNCDPEDEILGRSAGNEVILQVDPPQELRLGDGRTITGAWNASRYRDTLRHELTHVAADRLGLRGTWLQEGLAHFVEWVPIVSGAPELEPPPEGLRLAARIPKERRSLKRLFAWQHSFPPTDADREARLLALALVAYGIERAHGSTFRERLDAFVATDTAALRALESDWCTWLDRFAVEEP